VSRAPPHAAVHAACRAAACRAAECTAPRSPHPLTALPQSGRIIPKEEKKAKKDAAPAQSLTRGWQHWFRVVDPSSGGLYFWHEASGETTWTEPLAASVLPVYRGKRWVSANGVAVRLPNVCRQGAPVV